MGKKHERDSMPKNDPDLEPKTSKRNAQMAAMGCGDDNGDAPVQVAKRVRGRAAQEEISKEIEAEFVGDDDDSDTDGEDEEDSGSGEGDEDDGSDYEYDDETELGLLPDEFGDGDDDKDGDDDEDYSSGDLMADDDPDLRDGGEGDSAAEGDEEGEGARQEARRRSGALAGTTALGGASDDDDDGSVDGDDDVGDDDDDSGGAGGAGTGGFMQGAKGASFAKAFSKLLNTKTKAKSAADDGAPILAASKSLARRKAEETVEAAARREAKQARLQRRRRGHVTVSQKGEDPVNDQREKQLSRLATRGVVLLFNAIANAQKQAATGPGGGPARKVAKLSKASFLAQLKGGGAAGGAGTVSGAGCAAAGGGVLAGAAGKGKDGDVTAAAVPSAAPGWKVLQGGFSGLSGGGKMKDWDRKPAGSDEEDERSMGVGAAAGSASESEGDDDGW